MSVSIGFGLGRIAKPDPRDRRFLMRDARPAPATLPAYRYYRAGPVLDQGATSSCVGHAWRGWLSAAPLMTRTGPDAFAIYHGAQTMDEWEGENYLGSSVRGGAKYLQQLGHVASYLWAFNAQDIATWLLAGHGSVVLGINWYEAMFDPDRLGIIHKAGALAGGHAILCVGYSQPHGLFRLVNSWGGGWGEHGRAWISGEDLESLMAEDGEAACGTEQRIQP
jgi:hypothetical protein